ncbi:succinate dehydrogenase, hydrophobic membrane anchor protein [Sagittula stellata]|uniref:Succinate dehydrogenase hydrophobic membrane anchor subunit n=1 Tax=Sagittula stellata (strain ATCC 700073 / DSM 11524 / E-37) TaxID=388399 RepID=A3K3K2_SAGS3|nr:succinate dehydrogenase, hydrophobic membrane anchor protein [Sagittula stellata]EBA08116.1 succinate dehydrogenase, hydrophobic membrane anchor protein [Sagittula stellata E-37]
MQYLTDRKRAQGLGSGRTGTQFHKRMLVTSMALVVLVPLFVFSFGSGFGGSYEDVQAFFARPFPAIITALMLVVGVIHFNGEAQEAIEDYVHGTTGKLLAVAVTAFSYVLIAAGLFALVRLAL